jgi:tRNA U38,U39,U40 pseudouridine synthase TruA
MANVCVLGEGAWGTAVAILLARNGHTVTLWCHDQDSPKLIARAGCNARYLPDICLNKNIKPTHDLAVALASSEYVFEAIPVQFLRALLEHPSIHRASHDTQGERAPIWVLLSKGIEADTLMTPREILHDVLGPVPYAVLSGPSFAYDVARDLPTAVMLAAKFPLAPSAGEAGVSRGQLEQALQVFVGTHDFRSFCTGQDHEFSDGTVRTIDSITVEQLPRYGALRIVVTGPRFMRHMIRRLVGAAVHAQDSAILTTALAAKNPAQTLPNAPALGLVLRTIDMFSI